MDEKTKKAALEKVDYMNALVGYPSEFMDDKKLDDYYKNLTLYPTSFLKSKLSLNIFNKAHKFDQLRKQFDRSDWAHWTLGDDLIYDWSKNSIGKSLSQRFLKLSDS